MLAYLDFLCHPFRLLFAEQARLSAGLPLGREHAVRSEEGPSHHLPLQVLLLPVPTCTVRRSGGLKQNPNSREVKKNAYLIVRGTPLYQATEQRLNNT